MGRAFGASLGRRPMPVPTPVAKLLNLMMDTEATEETL
jgi:hypothetical protein